MSRTGLVTWREFVAEATRRQHRGPCMFAFFDRARERAAIYDTREAAESAFPELPTGNWETVALHAYESGHCHCPAMRLEAQRTTPAERIGDALYRIRRSRSASSN